MKEEKKLIRPLFIYFIVLMLAVLQIIISNSLSNYGKKISKLSEQTQEMNLANERIKKKIASSSALTTLTVKAKELGFIQKADVIYLDELYSVAQNSL